MVRAQFSGMSHAHCDTLAPMPMMVVINKLKAILGQPGTPEYNAAKAIVMDPAITTVAKAVEDSDVYPELLAADPANQSHVDEAKRVFSKLPTEANSDFLAALRSAFARNAPINVDWDKPGDPYDPTTPLEPKVDNPPTGTVTIKLRSPRGDVFAPAPPP
jgi:hypothetical protein